MSILLKNATYIDWKTLEFSQKNILVEQDNNTIQFVENIEQIANKANLEVT